MALNGFEAALKMRRDARREAQEYDALIQRAQALGIPTDLNDPATPKTVADLRAAVEAADEDTCECGMWPISEYGPRCPSC